MSDNTVGSSTSPLSAPTINRFSKIKKKYFLINGNGVNANIMIPNSVEIPPLKMGVNRCSSAWCIRSLFIFKTS